MPRVRRRRRPAVATILTTVAAGGALAASLLAGATVWWILTDPAGVATAAATRDWTVMAGALTRGVARAIFSK